MKKAPLLLPPAFVLLGLVAGRYFPGRPVPQKAGSAAFSIRDVASSSSSSNPPASSQPVTASPRLTQPVLADWQDFLLTLERATVAELPALWERPTLPEEGNTPGTSPRHRLLIERWTELDPAGALAFVKEKTPDSSPLAVIVFQTWAQHDPEAALTALQGEDHPKFRNHGIGGFLLSFREKPGQLIQWAKRFTWVDTAGLEARQFARACPDDLLRRLLDADRPGFLEIATHLPPWFQQRLENLTLLDQATTDLSAAIASLKARHLTKDGATALAGSLGSLAQTHPARAIALLDALSEFSGGEKLVRGDAGTVIGPGLVKYLAASDPAAAAAFITKHLDINTNFEIGEGSYHELFASNPAAALMVAQALLPFPPEMISVPVFKDRQSALTTLPEAPPSWRRDRALQSTLDQWHQESPDAARAWMETLPPGEFRDRAAVILTGQALHQHVVSLQLQQISLRSQSAPTPEALKSVEMATNMATLSDPGGTLALLGIWPAGPARQAAMEKAASVAAGHSTSQALDWAQQIPDPGAQAEAVRGVLGVWTKHEPLAASEWLPTLAPGPVREAAVDRFSETIAELDPAASLAWAVTLTDPAARAVRLESTWRKWSTDDPAEATAALAEVPGLTPADLQQLQNPPAPAAR